ncbi:MAG TPA: 3-hydroxyacyl-CoA dehydrogenase NAD-binding domain-containing protein, partial [Gemmatimonadales bacterium]
MKAPRVVVIGAGTMGHGVAFVAALAECDVVITDARPDALPHALSKIAQLLDGAVNRGKLLDTDRSALERRLHVEAALPAAVRGADVVIEAVVEDLAIKQRLFADVERFAPADALLASNTSSLSIGAIASALANPDRLVGMHFFNPVHVMRLVEVVTHGAGSRAAADRAVEFARRLKKEP